MCIFIFSFVQWMYPSGGGEENMESAALGIIILWTTWYMECVCIGESVDSLCRDGTDTTHVLSHIEWLRTPKRGSYKPL